MSSVGIKPRVKTVALVSALFLLLVPKAGADTLFGALAEAYRTNPQLNAQRAAVRATDENVPIALSGYRPRISATGTLGSQSLSTTSTLLTPLGAPAEYYTQSGYNAPHSVGVTATQNLYDGNQTASRTRGAESQVKGARQDLRNTEQQVMLAAATAYMNLLRDNAILELQKRNVEVLQEQLRNTEERFRVGEVTETDIQQASSRLSAAQVQFFTARSNYAGSVAAYKEAIGSEPGKLEPGAPVDRFIPKTEDGAVGVGLRDHPAIVGSQFAVDVALAQVKVAESALSPQLSLQVNAQKGWEPTLSLRESYSAAAIAQLAVPIYQGGAEFAQIRQAKETYGQRRMQLDLARNQVRQAIRQAWAQVKATQSAIPSSEAQVRAAERALNGVQQETRVGQRTTLDVLNAQQELVNARAALVTAQRDRVVASFTLLAAIGKLSPEVLGLATPTYQPGIHYQQVRDAWSGTRTPSGR